MNTALYFIHALSPLHAGTGQSVGAIDLPIARERPTGIPLVPGSSIKGALRARYDRPDKHTIFGPDTENAAEFAGAVQFSDAHLLLLPVRSIAGTFAWVTSPYLLQRFARDANQAQWKNLLLPTGPQNVGECLTAKEAAIRTKVNNTPKVLLEDFDFSPSTVDRDEKAVANLADKVGTLLFPNETGDEEWRKMLKARLCIVHDDVMAVLLETATEVVARIRLDENTKTVSKGALWYEESLPTESVLYGLVAATGVSQQGVKEGSKRQVMTLQELLAAVEKTSTGMLQLGGKSTVGRGVCQFRMKAGVA